WSVVKATSDPAWSFDRSVEAGPSISSPRKAQPQMPVIRTNRVSPAPDCVPIRKVKWTRSPTRSLRTSSRSSASSMPSRRRSPSMFSISMGCFMLGPFARPGRGLAAAVVGARKARRHERRLIPFRDLRRGLEDATLTVNDQEKTMGDLGKSGVQADEDIHPVVFLPQPTNLQLVQVAGLA